jgi:AmiR/NasT family two-component response regulator
MAKRHFMVRRKRDANHKTVCEALEAAGARIFDLSGVGQGCPDVCVLKPNKRDVVLMEIKTEKGALKKSQEQTHSEWPIVVVRNVDEALQAIGCRIGRRMRDEGREQGSR